MYVRRVHVWCPRSEDGVGALELGFQMVLSTTWVLHGKSSSSLAFVSSEDFHALPVFCYKLEAPIVLVLSLCISGWVVSVGSQL